MSTILVVLTDSDAYPLPLVDQPAVSVATGYQSRR
jgi:hypothetical protein